MRYVRKRGQPPQALIDWCAREWDPRPEAERATYQVAKDLWEGAFQRAAAKGKTLEALCEDQGYLCAYCSKQIRDGACHIEHLQARSVAPLHTFDFANLLASCNGENSDSCGHKRKSNALLVHPLLPDCEGRFRYLDTGGVLALAEDDDDTSRTIATLGLDNPRLRRMRQGAICALLKAERKLGLSREQMLRGYLAEAPPTPLSSFLPALCYALRSRQ